MKAAVAALMNVKDRELRIALMRLGCKLYANRQHRLP